jgi:hypothetical protein
MKRPRAISQKLSERVSYFSAVVSYIPSLCLLAYCGVLITRLATNGVGHIGRGVILIAYMLAANAALLGMLSSYFARRHGRITLLHKIALLLAALAVVVWLALHLSGLVYSYESQFKKA